MLYLNSKILNIIIKRYRLRREITTSTLTKMSNAEHATIYNNWTKFAQRRLYATQYDQKSRRKQLLAIGSGIIIGLSGYAIYHLYNQQEKVHALQSIDIDIFECHNTIRHELPTYKMSEIGTHSSENSVWVTYGIGVYDITKFIPLHPGRDKIMIGAGSAIEPFWNFFQQHKSPEILKMLETYRIGNLSPEDAIGINDLPDPWSTEPIRHAALTARSQRPFNAEPPASVLTEQFLTPADFFYVRNHMPVPEVEVENYELEIDIEGTDKSKILKLNEILALPKHNITATIMCGGNRRSEMTQVKPVKGLSWGMAAVGNAVWSGPKLCDILKEMGIESNENQHVHFEGLDHDPTSTPYAASIPLTKAMDPRGDVILAYEMNGKPLNRDHGYPLRVIVPGVVGARNVKWLSRIAVSDVESNSHWQQSDYKGFSPSTDWDTVDFKKSPAIQNMPVTSAICHPDQKANVKIDADGFIEVKGYAWSGGGNNIVRVDITLDKGKSWHVAELKQDDGNDGNLNGRNWSWTLWTAKLPVPKNVNEVEIWSKAVDSNYNVQPETFENTWNLRGVLSSAYHRVKVNIV